MQGVVIKRNKEEDIDYFKEIQPQIETLISTKLNEGGSICSIKFKELEYTYPRNSDRYELFKYKN